MKEIKSDDLVNVLGGARAVAAARSNSDQQLQLALLKMQTDLKDAAREPQNNQMAMMTFAIAAMAMKNRGGFA